MTTEQDKRAAALAALSELEKRAHTGVWSAGKPDTNVSNWQLAATIREALAAPDARVAELEAENAKLRLNWRKVRQSAIHGNSEKWEHNHPFEDEDTGDVTCPACRTALGMAALAPGEPKEGEPIEVEPQGTTDGPAWTLRGPGRYLGGEPKEGE